MNIVRLVRNLRKDKYALFLSLVVPLSLIIRLTSLPQLSFNEGWVLSVARNWAKLGHYGQLMNGAPVSASMLNVGFPAIAPIASSFGLLGVGIWQGRLPGVFFTSGCLLLIYHLARQLYDRPVARGTLAVLLLMSVSAATHPIVIGREAQGEMPSMFYLLAGYLCFISSFRKSPFFLLFTCIFWGLALNTKLQALPFLTVSLAAVFLIVSFRRAWRLAGVVGAALLGSLVAFGAMRLIQMALLHSKVLPETQPGIYSVTAFVPVVSVRVFAFRNALLIGVPTLLGLCYTIRISLHNWREVTLNEKEVVRLSILILVVAWMAWFALLSIGWARYLFPPIFLGSIFLALMLYNSTEQFDFKLTFQRAAEAMGRQCNRQNLAALLTIALIASTLSLTLASLYSACTVNKGQPVLDVVNFINKDTRPNAMIETFDMELFFLLDRPYHYPPNQLEIQLNRRAFLGEEVSIDYDPLELHPDYLVVGPYSKLWRLYDPVLKTGAFRLMRTYGPYDIYQRSDDETLLSHPYNL
jgi:4-amino-4-deoxy-L-arabinose transferase-like glycosyltransferase